MRSSHRNNALLLLFGSPGRSKTGAIAGAKDRCLGLYMGGKGEKKKYAAHGAMGWRWEVRGNQRHTLIKVAYADSGWGLRREALESGVGGNV